ncbi:MAG: zinc ribbon domain-containing protein [Lachnospiraceae bacterium]|nr:zinc ribbon domain-containing protein [Lachnospiraceae bacterium]
MEIVILILAVILGSLVYSQIESRFIRFGTLSGIITAKIGMWIGCVIVSFYVISFIFTGVGNLLKGILPYLLALAFIIGTAVAIYELYKTLKEGKDLFVKFFPKKTQQEKSAEYNPESMYSSKNTEPEPVIVTEGSKLFCTNCGSVITNDVSFCTSCGAKNSYKIEN